MRKIKNTVFMLLAVLPLAAYLFAVFRSGTTPDFLGTVTAAFGDYGAFFEPIISPMLANFVSLASSEGIALFAWLIGYYVSLLLVYLIFSLFTFLITMFMDKIDSIKGGGKRL